jgi:hypothetical protein
MGNSKKTVESGAGESEAGESEGVGGSTVDARAAASGTQGDAEKLRKHRNNVAVMVLLGFDVLVGGGIGYVGFALLESQAITLAGTILATIGLILMLIYQLVGREK